MSAVIDLGSELLVDRSAIPNPYVRLLVSVVGQALAHGSPWVALDKRPPTARRRANRRRAGQRVHAAGPH